MDMKKLATVPPAAGGWRTGGETSPGSGWAARSRASVVDDHSRLAYSEALPDEKAPTVVGFTIRALQFYREYGITHIGELMTDNHPGYIHSLGFKALLTGRGIKRLTIKPYNPQRNGKVERYRQTLKPKWANRQARLNEETRTRALPEPPTPHQPRRKSARRQTGNNLAALYN